MKLYGALATFAYAVLVVAAVWLGGLNQDEGWYLYAANLVREGKVLYRDFFFTQGPLLPVVYSPFAGMWRDLGLLGGRLVTAGIGLVGMLFSVALARMLAPGSRRGAVGVMAFLLLGCNLYHVYYLAIPKTYALASLFLMAGFYLLAYGLAGEKRRLVRPVMAFSSGLCMALACGARISLGAALAVTGLWLLLGFRRYGWTFAAFALGGAVGLAAVYAPVVTLPGFHAAIAYHAARAGFDPVFTLGSLSRLVRWYLPIFVLAGLAIAQKKPLASGLAVFARRGSPAIARSPVPAQLQSFPLLLFIAFLAVFAVQIAAPYPYEDYQVPIMGLLAVCAAVWAAYIPYAPLLALGLAWAASFGSPLLEKWTLNGQDRFWAIKKEKSELEQLSDVANIIEALDPGGKEIFTQDTYLAIETGRKVPQGLEMGPFAMLSDDEWRELLTTTECEIVALSGYAFAIEPPACTERDMDKQLEYLNILKKNYSIVYREEAFGQNATPLVILKRRKDFSR